MKRIGAIFYTDNQLKLSIAHDIQKNLERIGIPIVSCSLKPMKFGENVVVKMERGYVAMFTQILKALETSKADYTFFLEHDCKYHPSHFQFTPPRDDTWYYNINLWKVNAETGHAIKTDNCKQVSGICVNRELAVTHYTERLRRVNERLAQYGEHEFNSWVRKMGFEPGTHNRPEKVDSAPSATWTSAYPNLDIRHGGNLTATRWSPEQFVNKKFTEGWQETDIYQIPGWKKEDFAFLKLDR